MMFDISSIFDIISELWPTNSKASELSEANWLQIRQACPAIQPGERIMHYLDYQMLPWLLRKNTLFINQSAFSNESTLNKMAC